MSRPTLGASWLVQSPRNRCRHMGPGSEGGRRAVGENPPEGSEIFLLLCVLSAFGLSPLRHSSSPYSAVTTSDRRLAVVVVLVPLSFPAVSARSGVLDFPTTSLPGGDLLCLVLCWTTPRLPFCPSGLPRGRPGDTTPRLR